MSGTKMVIQRVFYKLHWFENQGSALGIPMGRLRDPTFLGHPPALVAMRELAELTRTVARGPSKAAWSSQCDGCTAAKQTSRLSGTREERPLTFSKADAHRAETRWLPKGICTQHKYDVFTKFWAAVSDVQGINEKRAH